MQCSRESGPTLSTNLIQLARHVMTTSAAASQHVQGQLRLTDKAVHRCQGEAMPSKEARMIVCQHHGMTAIIGACSHQECADKVRGQPVPAIVSQNGHRVDRERTGVLLTVGAAIDSTVKLCGVEKSVPVSGERL